MASEPLDTIGGQALLQSIARGVQTKSLSHVDILDLVSGPLGAGEHMRKPHVVFRRERLVSELACTAYDRMLYDLNDARSLKRFSSHAPCNEIG